MRVLRFFSYVYPLNLQFRFRLSVELTRLTWNGIAEPVSLDQIFRRTQGPGDIHFPGRPGSSEVPCNL